MSEAEIVSGRSEMSRKTFLGSTVTNCFPFTKEEPEKPSAIISTRKMFSDRIVCVRAAAQIGDIAVESFPS
jgi:hypothetical protein